MNNPPVLSSLRGTATPGTANSSQQRLPLTRGFHVSMTVSPHDAVGKPGDGSQ
ncbi:MAG: hypothetical protein R3D55_08965 [Chloroflexota bacterium]